MPKLQKSNDTFGESELNTVLMKLMGNDPSGNALIPTPLPTTGATTGASLGTLPLGTATVLPTVAPVSAPVPTPVPTVAPLPPPLPTPLVSVAPTPVPALSIVIPPTASAPVPAPSPVILAAQSLGGSLGSSLVNIASGLFAPTPAITGLTSTPPQPLSPVLPATNLGAAFTSVATIPPNPVDLARQFIATQELSDFDKPQLEQVINVRGKPLKPTKDPLEMEISAGNQLLNKIRTKGTDTKDLTGDIKINYERALELRRQVTAKAGLTKARKEATSASKKEKDARRESITSQAPTVSGSPNETKAQKQSRMKAEKVAEKAAKASAAGAAGI